MKLQEMKEMSAYMLADEEFGYCGTPDSSSSPGASLLIFVRDELVDYIEKNPTVAADELRDMQFELTDGAIDIATHSKWLQFVDLAAYQESPEMSETWGEFNTLDKLADQALGQIVDRLFMALVQAWENNTDDEAQ
jgi:hypothetical protein